MRILLTILSLTCWFETAHAEQSGDDTANQWRAVGRLDLGDGAFCTGTLIAPDLVITAAHCLFLPESGAPRQPERIRFLAGLSPTGALASSGVAKAVLHPSYHPRARQRLRTDIALLHLSTPIEHAAITPFTISSHNRANIDANIIAYDIIHPRIATQTEGCAHLGTQEGILAFRCPATFGASGAPIFEMGPTGPRLISIVTAIVEQDQQNLVLGMDLAEPLATLRLALAQEQIGG